MPRIFYARAGADFPFARIGGDVVAVIHVVEPGPTGGPGAMGCKILCASLREHGHHVTHVRLQREGEPLQAYLFSDGEVDCHGVEERPDAYYISTIYTRQWTYLPSLFRRLGISLWQRDRSESDPLVAFGGQTSYAPEPIADFADVIALGDGELTGNYIAGLIDQGLPKRDILADLDGRRGFYVPSRHPGESRPAFQRWEAEAYEPRIIYPGDNSDSRPTIEVARGCKSKCAFCPIGWAGGTYREGDPGRVKDAVVAAVTRGHGGVNLFAPDYSSVTYVDDLDRFAASVGCANRGVDARLDRAQRHLALGGTVKSFSFGVEGLSERLRCAIGKPLTRAKILDVMASLSGAFSVKWYMIVGLPGEAQADMEEFKDLLSATAGLRRSRLNVTLTPLQAVPHTPLERVDMRYNEAAVARALELRAWCRERWEREGWMILCSGVKGRELHEHDAFLQRCDRRASAYLARANGSEGYVRNGTWRRDAEAAGICIEDVLSPIPPEVVTPWDFVDVGIDPRRKRVAYSNYMRALESPEAANHVA